jgi:predicted nuclease with TOPRIM domain
MILGGMNIVKSAAELKRKIEENRKVRKELLDRLEELAGTNQVFEFYDVKAQLEAAIELGDQLMEEWSRAHLEELKADLEPVRTMLEQSENRNAES